MVSCDSWYIRLSRNFRNSSIWTENVVFGHRDALIDILLSALPEPGKIIFNGEEVELERGEFVTSQDSLCVRFRWSRQKVRTFLKNLEKNGLIALKTTRKNTIIRVVNYEQYLDCDNNKEITNS